MKYTNLLGNACLDALKVRFFLLREWVVHVARYVFRKPFYLCVDIALVLSYFFKSPYRMVREWDEQQSEKIGPYGELPLSEMERICSVLLVDKTIQTFYDLGAGRGRLALWAALVKGWKACAVELHPTFCRKLDRIVHFFHVPHVRVIQGDYGSISLEASDLVVLNPGELEAVQEQEIEKKLSSLKKGGYLLSIGFQLSSPSYEVEGMMPLICAWGDDWAILQRKIR